MAASEADEIGADRRAAASLAQECFTVDGETLEDIVARVNQYNSRQLVIVDGAIKRFRISGRVCPTRLDALIHGLHHLGISAVGAGFGGGRGVIRLSGVRLGRRGRAAK